MIRAAIDEGRRRSPTFGSLVETVERSNTFVYVLRANMLPHQMEGCLVSSSSQSQYLKVLIARNLGRDRTITVVAHELQHVREVLEAGGPSDQAAFNSLFARIGERQPDFPTQRYETDAAQRVMEIVRREVREFRQVHRRW